MEDPWKTLAAAGLPEGAIRERPASIDFPAVRRALAAINPASLQESHAVILLAYLEGWRHHWPVRYAREIGEAGERLRKPLQRRRIDENRYLKLRRIAVENLATAL